MRRFVRQPSDEELHERAAAWTDCPRLEDLTAARLRAIAAGEGIDFATALLYDRVMRSSRHAPFIARIDALRGQPPAGPRLPGVTFAVAPGAFYRELPHVGADGRLLRDVAADCGCRTELIPVPTTGDLRSNAQVILEWLRRQPARPIILASLSKGGADLRLAMQAPDATDAFRHVVGWINVCGMIHGTPLVPALLARRWRTLLVKLLFRWRGFDFEMVRDLHPRPDGLLGGKWRIPRPMRIVSIIGFPRQQHMTNRRSRMWRRALDPLGPNEGAVLLHDVCALPGVVYPVWGADHYLSPAGFDLRSLAAAILHDLAEHIDARATGPQIEQLQTEVA